MRKSQKKKLMDCVDSLREVHKEIKEAVQKKAYAATQNMLADCQELAIAIGESIEQSEGAGHTTVLLIEAYCEVLFRVSEEIRYKQEAGKSNFSENDVNENKVWKILNKQLIKVENSINNDITVRLEMVFFPYKASMWDSLESVYLAAKEDPTCDAYCVPVPYFDMKPGHIIGQIHYEGGDYPENIRITDWQTYNFEERKPDVIFIHNPYDDCNLVTSVHPRYYSSNLKKYTEKLVYIPYYATSGGMAAAQRMLPAYLYADYIVIQAPQFREYFDKSIPDEKFLPFGSPKFDRVINKCQNPPKPPKEWMDKMVRNNLRKRVIFYNTSLSGMLKDTETFLKKMEYVFNCFAGREDVCLLWRPHPLLETTFDSMRPQFRQVYDALKRRFLEEDLGIYDTTTDIEYSIALSDAYIGDEGTSVTSLFGVAGKPIFILNNRILEEPGEEDWKKEKGLWINCFERGRFAILGGNKLYISEPDQYDYRYFCDLNDSPYSRKKDYSFVCEINKKLYICPKEAQDILVVGARGVEKRIKLKYRTDKIPLFMDGAWKYKNYLLMLPMNYPAIVRLDTETGEIRYFDKEIDVFVKEDGTRKITSFSKMMEGKLYIASPTDNKMYQLDIESGEEQVIELPVHNKCGCSSLAGDGEYIWLLPYWGKVIVQYNIRTGKIKEYADFPADFTCMNPEDGSECEDFPFTSGIVYKDYLYLAPQWANMYLRMDIRTGNFSKWVPSCSNGKCTVFQDIIYGKNGNIVHMYSSEDKKLYGLDLDTNMSQEIKYQFDMKELMSHEPGFWEYPKTSVKYACFENYFNTLGKFLDGDIAGNLFNKERQLMIYKNQAVSLDGCCGRKLYCFLSEVD